MDRQPEILSFVKAMASADRLRIVGLLSQGSKRAAEIAEALGMHSSDVMRHLEQLTDSSVVSETDGVYDLNEKAIESLARGQFEGKRPVYVPEEDSEEDVRKVLKAYLNAGRQDDARRLLRTRRRGSSGVPVSGLGAVHTP